MPLSPGRVAIAQKGRYSKKRANSTMVYETGGTGNSRKAKVWERAESLSNDYANFGWAKKLVGQNLRRAQWPFRRGAKGHRQLRDETGRREGGRALTEKR